MQCDLEMTKQSGTHTQLHMASIGPACTCSKPVSVREGEGAQVQWPRPSLSPSLLHQLLQA